MEQSEYSTVISDFSGEQHFSTIEKDQSCYQNISAVNSFQALVTSISGLISLFLTWNTPGTRAPHLLIGVALDQDRCPGAGLRQGRGLPFLDLGHGLDLEVVAGHKHIHNFRVSPTDKFC